MSDKTQGMRSIKGNWNQHLAVMILLDHRWGKGESRLKAGRLVHFVQHIPVYVQYKSACLCLCDNCGFNISIGATEELSDGLGWIRGKMLLEAVVAISKKHPIAQLATLSDTESTEGTGAPSGAVVRGGLKSQ